MEVLNLGFESLCASFAQDYFVDEWCYAQAIPQGKFVKLCIAYDYGYSSVHEANPECVCVCGRIIITAEMEKNLSSFCSHIVS